MNKGYDIPVYEIPNIIVGIDYQQEGQKIDYQTYHFHLFSEAFLLGHKDNWVFNVVCSLETIKVERGGVSLVESPFLTDLPIHLLIFCKTILNEQVILHVSLRNEEDENILCLMLKTFAKSFTMEEQPLADLSRGKSSQVNQRTTTEIDSKSIFRFATSFVNFFRTTTNNTNQAINRHLSQEHLIKPKRLSTSSEEATERSSVVSERPSLGPIEDGVVA